jgi:butyryl-CoA dehydrogenase
MQLPWLAVQACSAIFSAANIGLYAYPFLTTAAANLLHAFGSEEQRSRYLPLLLSGKSFGTMCLSEPQAGSSLGDIRSKATPTAAGHYLISGSKMWISGGEHELADNILHMVLAKIPGGPPGVRGISLFLVPKRRLNADGSLGERNNVVLAGLNHKMGYRGTVNTLLNFGEGGECHGFLVGEPNQGLSCMFHMMNEARIGVGLGAAVLGYAGYLCAVDYARSRPQGRRIENKDPNAPQVPIIEHADIRRLLLTQKSYVEGGLALVLYCARLIDDARSCEDPTRAGDISRLLDVLTPIAKSWPSEFCLEANKHAIQVLGGYGYTRDYPVERLYRDNRLNPIHEGTHGIQGIDLLGRKVRMVDGKAFAELLALIRSEIAQASAHGDLAEYAAALEAAVTDLEQTTQLLVACADIQRALANATLYLDAMGHVVIAWIWLKQALAATIALAEMSNEGESERNFYRGKLSACRYFYRYELPKAHSQMQVLRNLDDTCLRIADGEFA